MFNIGVVIGSGFIDRAFRIAMLTKDGESYVSLKQDICFSIPSICSADLAARCGLDAFPENAIQLNARIEVLKRLREVQRQVEVAVVGLSRQLHSIYETLRSKDPSQWTEVTASEVANMIHKNPTAIEIYAIHKLLMDNPMRFLASNQYAANQTFRIRPMNEVKDLEQVQQWVREKSPALGRFISKAREVADVQVKLRESSREDQPSYVKGEHLWSETDKTIIRLCVASLGHQRSIQLNPYLALVGHIIRHFYDMRTVKHDDHEIHRLLMDIGVFTPWEDLLAIDAGYRLDLDTRPAVVQERDQVILRALENSKEIKPHHPEDFYPVDPLESIRHDWGNLAVYVVDDVGAEELDDGFSVERIESEPGSMWLHVHIADPGSVIPPTHFLAQNASQQAESWYTVPRTFPLFPKSLVHHPVHGLSLGIRSKNGIPDRVLTFSAKLDSAGNIVDYAVRAGLVRNVNRISYDSVDVALQIPSPLFEYPFGGAPISKASPAPSDFVEDLKAIREIALKQRERRIAMNWLAFNRNRAEVKRVSKFPSPPNGIVGAQIDTPHLNKGFPNLVYIVSSTRESGDVGFRSVVAEMMKLSCRVAARFFTDRNVPAPYRTGQPLIPTSEKAIEKLLSKRDELGYIQEAEGLTDFIYEPRAQYQLNPGMHFGLAIPEGEGYVRVTSPLRRYNDLVAHWQIHKVLLNEKEGKTSKDGVKGMFDKAWMHNYINTLEIQSQTLKGIQRRHNRYWALNYINNWQQTFKDGKNRHLWPRDPQGNPIPDPLEGLEGYTISGLISNQLVQQVQLNMVIPKLGLQPIVEDVVADLDVGVVLGTKITVNLKDIRLGMKANMITTIDSSRMKWPPS